MIIRTRDMNIAKFYGYRREDIEQWLDESEYHLQTRDISPTREQLWSNWSCTLSDRNKNISKHSRQSNAQR